MEGLEERRVKKQPKWLFFPPTTKARRAPRPSPVNKVLVKDFGPCFFFYFIFYFNKTMEKGEKM